MIETRERRPETSAMCRLIAYAIDDKGLVLSRVELAANWFRQGRNYLSDWAAPRPDRGELRLASA